MTNDIGTTDPQSRVSQAVALITQGLDLLATADLTTSDADTLITIAKTTEKSLNRLTFQSDRVITEINHRDIHRDRGYRTIFAFMDTELHASNCKARLERMDRVQPERSLTGEPTQAEYPELAKVFASGDAGTTHIDIALSWLKKIPLAAGFDEKIAAERTLAGHATEFGASALGTCGSRIIAHIDPDGELIEKKDRDRRRGISLGKQGADGMSKLTGYVDPILRARLETLFAAWGKHGVNNPDTPNGLNGDSRTAEVVDPDGLEGASVKDMRTQPQRNHDAVNALLTAVLADGMLGKTNMGVPIQLIVKTDVNDLIREAGYAITATGTLIPMSDLVDLAADAQMYLSVFKDHTAIPLYFGQAKRIATKHQRLMLFSAPDGHHCSAPGCDRAAAHVEIHHAVNDFADGGRTDIIELAPACPTHHRMVGDQPGQYTTGKIRSGPDEGRTWWQRNAKPGQPDNEKQVNRLPDVGQQYVANLAQVRAEIHGTETNTTTTTTSSTGQPGKVTLDSTTDDGFVMIDDDALVIKVFDPPIHIEPPIDISPTDTQMRLPIREVITPVGPIETRLVEILEGLGL
ncbi:HNH endonuclease signature motif containing protein [Gordonia sp. NB41Y]|nr:HNH endonuclease signature motif containing protein [Gordonia sp. NB41Y]EMP12514.2 hypothetical protein ISGA_1923 [Gordonia sp. NB41Y]WLP91437.1 DUF222 domain-containing protein [Gordonia sp. NB41Y]